MSALLSTKRSRLPRPRRVFSRVALRDVAGARASRSSSTRSTRRASASIRRRALRMWPGNQVNAISGLQSYSRTDRRARFQGCRPRRSGSATRTRSSSPPHAAGQDHRGTRSILHGNMFPTRAMKTSLGARRGHKPLNDALFRATPSRERIRHAHCSGKSPRAPLGPVSRRYGWRGFCRFLLLCRFPKRSDVRGPNGPAAGLIDGAQLAFNKPASAGPAW